MAEKPPPLDPHIMLLAKSLYDLAGLLDELFQRVEFIEERFLIKEVKKSGGGRSGKAKK